MLASTMSSRALPCPCGGPTYEGCCAPFHRGAEPPDAERLMRSRYAAFVRRDVAYLYRTLHPDHEDRSEDLPAFERRMKAFFAGGPAYLGLRILETTPPDAEGIATVTFRASIRQRGRDRSFTERSLFAHDGTGWRYLSGELGS